MTNQTETNPTVLHAHIEGLQAHIEKQDRHIETLQQTIFDIQAHNRQRDITRVLEQGKCPNSKATIANIGSTLILPKTKRTKEFREYYLRFTATNNILDYKLAEFTHRVNKDLGREMTEGGVARALFQNGFSYKQARDEAREKRAKKA